MSSKMDERYEGHFLDALDLPEGALAEVTIEGIVEPGAEKDSAGKVIKSAIIAFVGKHKRLILNKTNFKNLKAMFGRNPTDWIGKRINIQRRYLDAAHGFGVENTLCIRIIPPVGTPILKSAANFMGQPHPYGQPAKQAPKPAHKPKPPAATPASTMSDDPAEWQREIAKLESTEECSEFRDLLSKCPVSIRAQVEEALARREAELHKEEEEAG